MASNTNREDDSDPRERFDSVCRELNMDEDTSEEAWKSYERIRTNYSLEGKSIHWLACSLYVACRRSVVPTVDSSGTVEGNCVSLTRLIRASGLSLIDFFNKMKKWLDMSNASSEFRRKIEHLERNFHVSTVIFKKYRPIFLDLFRDPNEEVPKGRAGRKSRKHPCNPGEVFAFGWTLYVQAKGNFPAISDDLVNSYHLLLCCLDLVYGNASTAPHKKNLINPSFEGIVLEAKSIKEHYWKPFVHKLFEKKILKGTEDSLCGILDLHNFEANWKSINKEYEAYVLSAGDFDERIFLGEEAHLEIGTPAKLFESHDVEVTERVGLKRNLQEHFSKTRSLAPQTPLTGRRYLKDKDPKECKRNPLQSITSRIEELGEIFLNEYVQPSADRPNSPCSTKEFATRRLKLAEILYYKVLENITLSEKRRLQGHLDVTTLLEQDIFHRSLLGCCLEIVIFSYNSQRSFPWVIEIFEIAPYYFYKVIEVLIKAEDGLSRDVVKHLNHIEEQVLESLAWAQSSPLWDAIQSAGDVPSCEDVTIPNNVESSNPTQNLLASPIVHPRVQRISGEEGLQRRIVSPSASSVPEQYSPTNSGARRNLMANFGGPTPKNLTVHSQNNGPFARSSASIPTIITTTTGPRTTTPAFIITPAPSNGGYIINGGLNVVLPSSMSHTVQVNISPRPGSTLSPSVMVTSAANSPLKLSVPAVTQQPQTPPAKPKKTGSLALFFRKVYHMASVRLRDLCTKLEVNDELRGKMWTCFEHSLMFYPELAKDRHLDQVLMCSVYVMGKVTNSDLSFQNIMRCYRTQPQAASHVYRSVMLKAKRRAPINSTGSDNSVQGNNENSSGSTSPTGNSSARTSPVRSGSVVPPTPPHNSNAENTPLTEEERGDLIEFYNKIYIKRIKNFALKFSANDRSLESPPLSPLPLVRNQAHSPRRQVSTRHPVYISPHKMNGGRIPMTPNTRMLYCFSESPAKRLRDINNMIKQGSGESRKRALLQDDQSGIPSKRSPSEDHLHRKLTSMIEERNNANSR
ncbi:hypothetical protein QZH41_012866 [Actinostola sp. cb2023]|nr:hypothetical protein QZH41_012866 [Actinostola sp. cb2023]